MLDTEDEEWQAQCRRVAAEASTALQATVVFIAARDRRHSGVTVGAADVPSEFAADMREHAMSDMPNFLRRVADTIDLQQGRMPPDTPGCAFPMTPEAAKKWLEQLAQIKARTRQEMEQLAQAKEVIGKSVVPQRKGRPH